MKLAFASALLLSVITVLPASAQTVAPLDVDATQVYLVDAVTDTPLFQKDADSPMPTSSMSKMMTLYVVFDAIKNGKITMDSELPVSEHAWKQEGSRMFVNIGTMVRIEDLIRGVAVQSGNDAAVVLAEGLASGSESSFADMMNATAQKLGMKGSHFVNATGLPDPQHYSTAHDLATLGVALLRDFPQYYHYFSETEFTYNGIKQGNRNPLLYRNMNVDGIKTGHAEAAGYGLTASSVRDGRRLVMVLNGMKNMQARADESAKVLDYGYREFGLYPIAKTGDVMASAQVWLGTSPNVAVVAAQDAVFTLPRTARASLKAVVSFNQPIAAPIKQGQQIGTLTVSATGMEDKQIPLIAGADVDQVGFFSRLFQKLGHIFGGKKG